MERFVPALRANGKRLHVRRANERDETGLLLSETGDADA